MILFGIQLPELPSIFAVITVIICILINDVSWALYVRRVGEGLATKAGFWASSIYISGIVTTISVLHNYWLIVVAITTTFCGTSVTVWFDHKKKYKKNDNTSTTESVNSKS